MGLFPGDYFSAGFGGGDYLGDNGADMNANEWREECNYIARVTDKGGRVKEMNNDKDTFIRYLKMQQKSAKKEKFFDVETYIQECIDDLEAKKNPTQKRLTYNQWIKASTAQRAKWLDEGRLLTASAVTQLEKAIAATGAYDGRVIHGQNKYLKMPHDKNPAKRTVKLIRAKSQATGKTPTKRLIARRSKNTRKGYYPNPPMPFEIWQQTASGDTWICAAKSKDVADSITGVLNANAKPRVKFSVLKLK